MYEYFGDQKWAMDPLELECDPNELVVVSHHVARTSTLNHRAVSLSLCL